MVEEAYCMKCRKKVEAKNAHPETLKNKRRAMVGTCANCGTKVLKMMKKTD